MLEAGFEFPRDAQREVVETLLALPEPLRPTRFQVGENDVGVPIQNSDQQIDEMAARQAGFFLKSNDTLYDIIITPNNYIQCNCYIKKETACVRELMKTMAVAQPMFGFACVPEERNQRNRIKFELGSNTVESWVGRNLDFYIPGLYWLTLLPEVLAEKHHVYLMSIDEIALEHIELKDAQHLFRFYDRPEAWDDTAVVADFCASTPGIFDVKKAFHSLGSPKTFLEINERLRAWS